MIIKEVRGLVVMFLNSVLVLVTDLWAGLLGSAAFRHHFHLLLAGVILCGPALSLWVSKYSIFANRNHYLYRLFLHSGCGWTCIFAGAFVLILSFSVRRSLRLSMRHLSRIGIVGALWQGVRSLLAVLENAAGSCYQPVSATLGGILGTNVPGKNLLLLHEDESKASCLKAGWLWRGCDVSEDIFLLCLCCLLLAEETAILGPYLAQRGPSGAPLRLLFLLCVFLLGLWFFLLLCLLAHFPQFPSQLLGGALGYLGWRGLYQGWYRLQPSWWSPGWPGEGLLTTTSKTTPL
ncbi:hypothetical protein UPYG_G00071400 [Umbra pygmaea]|uniref:Fat storage-inducing transmembrane protein 1 homolog n=1 Tax=Umbra pygmaea TaxID=75934 RepID=A0ABD0XTE4_UMBPY